MAFVIGACAVGMVGCESGDEPSIPSGSESTSGPAARAIQNIRLEPARALAGVDDDFEVQNVVVDLDGSEHVHLNRRYQGLRVIGGDFIVHGHVDGSFRNVTQTMTRNIEIDFSKNIGADAAIAVGESAQQAELSDKAPTAELVVHARGERPVLAYEVLVEGTQADGTPSELHVIVDAEFGHVIEQWDGIETTAAAGTGKGYFVGSVGLTLDLVSGKYNLRDPSRGSTYTTNMAQKTAGNGTVFSSTTSNFGTGALTDMPSLGVDAQYGTGMTWDYFQTVHGRNGIANDGKGAFNRVNYGRKYLNAFWSDSCFCMTYGNGDGVTYAPFDSLDVAGHEMTHGVTSRTAKLVYSGESGGLNEATSDIMGAMVEYYTNNPNDAPDYLIGEKLYLSNPTNSKALRFMHEPFKDAKSPNCYSSTLGSLDVHYSSGVANHFYYLLAEGNAPAGGPVSPTCNGSSLTGIGRDKAAKIWYRALTVKFTSSTNYAGARAGTIAAANDLFGAGSPESNAVAAAWSAVSVN